MISPKYSLKGWDVKVWVAGNKEAIKIVVGAVVALIALDPNLAPLFVVGGVGAIISKSILDIVDFWSNNVKVN
jgi:hypothetical protein